MKNASGFKIKIQTQYFISAVAEVTGSSTSISTSEEFKDQSDLSMLRLVCQNQLEVDQCRSKKSASGFKITIRTHYFISFVTKASSANTSISTLDESEHQPDSPTLGQVCGYRMTREAERRKLAA